MKMFISLMLLSLTISAQASQNLDSANPEIVCSGVDFELARSTQPEIIKLEKTVSDFFISYNGKLNGNIFTVNFEKSSESVTGFIKTVDGVSHDANGAFTKKGHFDFGFMYGGNMPFPAKAVSIVCQPE